MRASAIVLSKDLDREGLIRALLPVVRKHVARLSRGPNSRVRDDDLMSAGMHGLFEATKHFDPTRVETFVGYANVRIRGAMLDELRKSDALSQELRTASRRVEQTIHRLEQKLSRAPLEEEIARAMDMEVANYRSLLDQLASQKVLSTDDDNNGESIPVVDSTLVDPEQSVERAQLKAILQNAIELLPLREQQVMALHYDHDLSFREVGEVMDLTAARVCQIHSLAVLRLRAHLGVASSVGDKKTSRGDHRSANQDGDDHE